MRYAQTVGRRWLPAVVTLVAVSCAVAGTDFSRVANPDDVANVTGAARKTLAEAGLVAYPTDYDQLHSLYSNIRKQNRPMFVTTDCVLHSFHMLFDYVLREVETEYFARDLTELTQALFMYEQAELKQAKGKPAKAALTANIAYLAVAGALLDTSFVIPKAVLKPVKAELALIAAHAGFDSSPVMGFEEDYSQYVPRGHYTRSALLSRYFQAMMWYGRIGFALKPGNQPKDIARGRDLTYRALLLCRALEQAAIGNNRAQDLWLRIYEPTVLLVGRSDDLSFADYARVATEVFGDKNILPERPNDVQLDDFIARALALPSPLIVSQAVADTLKPAQVTKGFRFMGQRYIPDSYIFQELVYNKVGTMSDPRMMPKGLDVMAALGSDRAYGILKDIYKENRYTNYETQVEKLRAEFRRLSAADWDQNVYFGWLYALKLQNEPLAANKLLPEFCFAPAYADKCLVTASGSWAQLRHDTILYAKQSYTMLTTAMPNREPEDPPQPVVYVEPRPAVFGQVQKIARTLHDRFRAYGILGDDMGRRLEQFQGFTATLAAIADKEVQGITPNPEEIAEAWRTGDILKDFSEFPGKDYTNDEDKDMATVADVHTDPNTKTVLEVAVGAPLQLYVRVPFGGKEYIATGGMFSYYEFTRPMAERMTDDKWQKLDPKPPLPEWTGSFIAR